MAIGLRRSSVSKKMVDTEVKAYAASYRTGTPSIHFSVSGWDTLTNTSTSSINYAFTDSLSGASSYQTLAANASVSIPSDKPYVSIYWGYNYTIKLSKS